MPSLTNSGYFLAIFLMEKNFQMEIPSLIIQEFDDPQVSAGLKVISNESMDFNDPKDFDDPQVFDDPRGNLNWEYGL